MGPTDVHPDTGDATEPQHGNECPPTDETSPIARAIEAFQSGEPVCIHDFDDREAETDLVYPATAVEAADVARMRNDAGGLICVALDAIVADAAELPYLSEALDHPAVGEEELAYGDRSSFSLTVNHVDTFTGITDDDRALTIGALGEYAAAAIEGDADEATFADRFRAPGHVHLLRAAPDLLSDRQGHTELGIALAHAAGVPPAVVVCEMLDDETGSACSTAAARNYAMENDLVFLDGETIVGTLG
jgi:3,4-dihydroxy 2-butanone 4-phosphate synthase